MSRLMNFLTRMLGLQSLLEDQIDRSLRMKTTLAGTMAQTEVLKEAEQHAADLEKTHPQLAAALRLKVAEEVARLTGGTPPAPAVVELPAAVPTPTPTLPDTAVKKGGRPKAALPAADTAAGGQ